LVSSKSRIAYFHIFKAQSQGTTDKVQKPRSEQQTKSKIQETIPKNLKFENRNLKQIRSTNYLIRYAILRVGEAVFGLSRN